MPLIPVLIGIWVLELVGVGPWPENTLFILEPSLQPPLEKGAGEPEIALRSVVEANTAATAELQHNGARLLYGSAVTVHLGLCLLASVYYLRNIFQCGKGVAVHILTFAGLVAGAIIFTMLYISPVAGWVASEYTFERLVDIWALHACEKCFNEAALTVLVMVPAGAGIITVLLAAGGAASALRRLNHVLDEEDKFVVQQLVSSFQMLSAVLVTSTISAMLFFRLALYPFTAREAGGDLVTSNDYLLTIDVTGYVNALTTFWGAVYTLTLFAVYVGPLALLYYRAIRKQKSKNPGEFLKLKAWLADNGVEEGFGERVRNLLTLLAPLMIGPLSQALGSIGGF